ncbi:MAG TPA: EthD domain-containing protein [Terriglobales bacterium]|nr:EthD domain-containing protein [Terriglobales bacterium]
MLKFMVVQYRLPGMSEDEFRRYMTEIHGPLAQKLPGLRRYRQNFVLPDPKRKHPGWDGIVELYFDNWSAMEAAWASPAGAASNADLPKFMDLSRSTWAVVDEVSVI